MKTKRMIRALVAVLLCVTAVLAAVHLATRERVPEGSLLIQYNEKKSYVPIDALALTEINGTIVNGKGEPQEVHQSGARLADVLQAGGIDSRAIRSVTAFADDEFSAELLAEEINAPDTVFLAEEPDESLKLIVFGDRDLKRNVRNVVRLLVQ